MGTPTMVRVITAGMLVYALVIGGLFVGYTRLQGCVADYSDRQAKRTVEVAGATSRSARAQIDVARAMRQGDDVRASAAELERALIEQEQLRAANPPPRPPSERCD
ncbi:hypothetical protein [Micromonospora sp. RP3T]|uniref:hypothetical protein n=1 Tax=Micromonospora sp. RP3T TaxID=2135446 RepID=UPI003D706076